jgi:hypothetical protein
MNIVEHIRQVYWKRKSIRNANALAKQSIAQIEHASQIRVKSASEPVQHYQKPGHGLFFCLHERSYFVECRQCRRDLKEANEHETEFMKKHAPTP